MIRISKARAKKLFATDKPVFLCPVKMYPDGPFSGSCLILGKEYLEQAERYRNHPDLWKGTIEETAWDLMYNNWIFYNASYDTGYYPAYYIEGK